MTCIPTQGELFLTRHPVPRQVRTPQDHVSSGATGVGLQLGTWLSKKEPQMSGRGRVVQGRVLGERVASHHG